MQDVRGENIGSDQSDKNSSVRYDADLNSKSNSNSSFDVHNDPSPYSGWTRLLRACRYGQTEIVVQQLSNGADPTACDTLGWNALPLAVASGNIATVREILKALKWNRKDLAPALCMAALDGDCEIAEILLASRADPNVSIKDSKITPLMLAAGDGHTDMVTLLLEHGADPDMTNALHQTALDASVIRDHLTVQNILGPATQLRSKISSHIPLPRSPPNRALQSPNSRQPDIRFFGASQFMTHCKSHDPGLDSSPMLHYVPSPSPMCASFCVPSSSFVAMSPALKSQGFLSPLPASYPSLVSPFYFSQTVGPMSPYQSQYPVFCHDDGLSSQNISGDFQGGPNRKSVSKGNTRLRKWWCQMKRRCKGDQPDRNEDKSDDVTMEKRLANFLRSVKMSEYHALFTSQEVDFETFLTLTEEDLEDIGVKNPAHRSKIVDKIEKFSKNATNI